MKSFPLNRWYSLYLLIVAVFILLLIPFLRIWFKAPINYNEGWNVYHSIQAISEQVLYDSYYQWTPVNYPPLSFYIGGMIGKLVSNIVLAERLISFISLLLISLGVGLIVRKLGGGYFEAIFAGTFCLGLFIVCAEGYIGMSDPQMLGHVFMIGGLLAYLHNPQRPRLFLTVLLLSFGLFIKHNLLALPIALTIDLFLKSRQLFLKWIIYFTLVIGSLTLLTLYIGGNDFINQLTIGREYSLERIKTWKRLFGLKIALPLLVTLPWVVTTLNKVRLRFIGLYLVFSIIIGVVASGGFGTGPNMFFDIFISLSIAVGLFLFNLQKSLFLRSRYNRVKMLILPIILSIAIFGGAIRSLIRLPDSIVVLNLKDQVFSEAKAFLLTQNEPVICESILLCYSAEKSFIYDPFLISQMMVIGRINEYQIIQKIESGYFKVIQLEQEIPNEYLQYWLYTSEPQLSTNERFTVNFMKALGKYYTLAKKLKDAVFYVPNQ